MVSAGGPFMVGRVCVPVPVVAGMTRVLKVQEKDFMQNAMDSRLRGNDKGKHEIMGVACAGMTFFFLFSVH